MPNTENLNHPSHVCACTDMYILCSCTNNNNYYIIQTVINIYTLTFTLCLIYLQHGRVPLHYAADGGHVGTIRALVTEFQCPPDCRDNVSGVYTSSDVSMYININIIITQWNLSKMITVLGSATSLKQPASLAPNSTKAL